MRRLNIRSRRQRLAGEFLQDKIDDLKWKVVERFVTGLVGGYLVFIAAWIYFFEPKTSNLLAISGFGLILFFASIYRILPIIREVQRSMLGLEGERLVSQYLHDNRDIGWKILNDVQMGKWNIDHIILAPQGIYCVETKTRAYKYGRAQDIHFNGGTISINGYQDKKALQQANNAREGLHKWLGENLPIHAIKSVIVFPGRWVDEGYTRNNPDATTWVLNPKDVCALIREQANILSKEQLERAHSLLKKYCCPDL